MTLQRFLTVALALSLAGYGLPAIAAGAERPAPGPIRASTDRAVGQAIPPMKPDPDGIRLQSSGGGGGGGGHVALILLGLAASAATTYFIIKNVQKQTQTIQNQTTTGLRR